MRNVEIEEARKYHERTKHSYESIRSDPHHLDWDNHPLPFKVYPDLESIPFPVNVPTPDAGALESLAPTEPAGAVPSVPDAGVLGRLLLLSAGITKKKTYPGGEMYFRAAACTGALYHIDFYVVCGDLPALDAGVYHFAPEDFGLRKLRSGDHRPVLVEASGGEPSVARAPAILVSASTYWRNAWKYRARAYRHCGWDNGTILSNLLAAASAYALPARIVCGFVDEKVNFLLGLEEGREAALSLVALGRMEVPFPEAVRPPALPPLALKTVPLSPNQKDYPEIRAIHTASCLATPEETAGWRGRLPAPSPTAPPGRVFPLKPADRTDAVDDHLTGVIIRRGSTRVFARKPLSFEQLSTSLIHSIRPIPADFSAPSGPLLNDVYLIVHAVESLPPGKYVHHPQARVLELLEEGEFRRASGHLGLGQSLPADASVNVYFMLDLDAVLRRFGNRGYRIAQLEAGILGGRLYLAAYAQGFGATGLTFFDDDVTDFFSPHARGKSVMFLVALGHKQKRPKL